jgi:hypothetical protein
MIPLYGFVDGDTLGLVLLARAEQTIEELANDRQVAASVRVAPRPRVELVHDGKVLDPRSSVGEAGLEPLDRIDVRALRE